MKNSKSNLLQKSGENENGTTLDMVIERQEREKPSLNLLHEFFKNGMSASDCGRSLTALIEFHASLCIIGCAGKTTFRLVSRIIDSMIDEAMQDVILLADIFRDAWRRNGDLQELAVIFDEQEDIFISSNLSTFLNSINNLLILISGDH